MTQFYRKTDVNGVGTCLRYKVQTTTASLRYDSVSVEKKDVTDSHQQRRPKLKLKLMVPSYMNAVNPFNRPCDATVCKDECADAPTATDSKPAAAQQDSPDEDLSVKKRLHSTHAKSNT